MREKDQATGRGIGVGWGLGLWLLVVSICLIGSVIPSTATAISTEDQQYISYLRSIFTIDSVKASDQRLAQILDSPKLGPSVKGDVDCAFAGEHALDGSGAERTMVEALLNEYEAVLAADQFADPLIVGGLGDSVTAEFLVALHQDLGGLHSALSTFVDSEAYLISDGDYRSWLAQYHGAESDGKTPEEAREEIEATAGSALDAVLQPRRLSADELFGQYEYASQCMTLDENATYKTGYANYIIGIAQMMGEYEKGQGLTLVLVDDSHFEAINTGKAQLNDIAIKEAGGGELGHLAELEPGAEGLLAVGSVGSAAKVSFTLDGIPGLEADYGSVASNLFVGQAVSSLIPSSPKTGEFSIDQGPFAAVGTSPTYEWSFEGGSKSTGATVTRSFSCYGPKAATFTAASSAVTVSRKTTLEIPPPYNVDWTSSTGEFAVAPGVPITFTADPSIPAGVPVSWNFGDGQSAQGHSVTHTFQSAAIDNVTMSVSEPGCSSLTSSHPVTVGRSDQWITLSGSIGSRTFKSSVAGYVIDGPVTVGRGQTLTVEPGAIVKFAPLGSSEPGQLVISGTLNVKGAEGAPAIFTSRYDDSAGGHCTCAGTGTPASGDWYGLTLLSGGTATFDHAEVRYAASALDLQGEGAHLSAVNSVLSNDGRGVYSAGPNDVAVRGSTFIHNGSGAELECFGCTYSPEMSGNRFIEDSRGLWVKGNTAAHIRGSTFEGVNSAVILQSTASRTSIEGTTDPSHTGFIEIMEGSLPTGVVRLNSDLPYAVFGQIIVPPAGQLALGPGTLLKFVNIGGSLSGNPGQIYVRGALVASGTGAAPVTFTSPYDDSAYGHCGCAKAGVSPASGDWYGVEITAGADATFDHANLRYAGGDVNVQGGGSNVRIANSVLDYSGAGLAVEGVSNVNVSNTSASHDNTGLQLGCNGCSYTTKVTNATFVQDSTGIGLTGNASAVIRSSSFDAADHWGIYNGGNATVDAVGNWWGASSGPRPTGTGALIVGNVSYQPFCSAPGQCTSVKVSAEPTAIDANGSATTTLTATVESPAGHIAGDHVYFASSDPGQTIGPVVDHGDGTYTATLTASHKIGASTVVAYDASLEPRPSGSVEIEQEAPTLKLSLNHSSVLADGESVIEATVSAAGAAGPMSGEPVEIASSDPGQTIGPVVDHGDGTYKAEIIASKTVGSATITATDGNFPGLSTTASVEQVAPQLRSVKVALTATPDPSQSGAPVVFLATVTPEGEGAPTPTGQVTFIDGTTSLGVVTLDESGTAKLEMASLSVGDHPVVAEYGGDSNLESANSLELIQIVTKAQTETTLRSSRNPAPFGSGGSLIATVRAVAPGSGTPTGTVTFTEGAAVLATVPLTERQAKLPLKGFAVGDHKITATYNGDEDFLGSVSAPFTQTITKLKRRRVPV